GLPLAISSDGQRVAYVLRSGDSALPMLYLRRIDAFEGTSVPGTEGASLPFFSPDGQWVGFLTASRMKKVPVEGGSVVEIMSVTDGAAVPHGAREAHSTWGVLGVGAWRGPVR